MFENAGWRDWRKFINRVRPIGKLQMPGMRIFSTAPFPAAPWDQSAGLNPASGWMVWFTGSQGGPNRHRRPACKGRESSRRTPFRRTPSLKAGKNFQLPTSNKEQRTRKHVPGGTPATARGTRALPGESPNNAGYAGSSGVSFSSLARINSARMRWCAASMTEHSVDSASFSMRFMAASRVSL